MKKEEILKDLNPSQKKAVIHDKGPLLIIAGAGTGKTRVITRRIAYLIASKKAQPHEILALTFTDKAASEMEERVDMLLPYGYTDIWVSTFHAFGERILREKALDIGLDSDFKVLTEPQQMIFIKKHLFEFPLNYFRPLGNPDRYLKALVTLFSRARDEDASPDDYLHYAEKLEEASKKSPEDEKLAETAKREKEIALSFKKYQELKSKEGMIDFGDQFYLILKIFREHPAILKEYQKQFNYILVDEFQDTNYSQFELIKLLAAGHKNLAVSADDDQSIYKFRGAAISNVMGFLKTYKDTKKIVITKNYRSTQPILDCAYRLIGHNNPDRLEVKAGLNKKLKGLRVEGQKPKHLHYDTVSYEADQVAKLIKGKVKEGKYTYQDFAILVRSNSNAEPFLQAMNTGGIPWRFTGNQGLYTREEIRLAISFFKVLANLSDSINLFYLAGSQIYKIEMPTLTLCMNYASRKNTSLYNVFCDIGNISELRNIDKKEIKKVEKFLEDIKKFLEFSRNLSSGSVLYKFLTETGYLKYLTTHQTLENEEKIKNLAKFFEVVKEFSALEEEDKVPLFVSHLELLIKAGDDPAVIEADFDIPAVNVLTIHKAKGLEFPVVFLVSLVMGRFPWPRRKDPIELPPELVKDILPSGDFFLQEERRLFYVGMTRAKDELYLTSSRDYGGKRLRKVSLFVLEALDLSKTDFEPYKSSPLESIKRYTPKPENKLKPKKTPSSKDKIVNLTPYKIDDYMTCPLKYKYVHILRVPFLEHHTVAYGKVLHDVIGEYFKRIMNSKKVTLEELLFYYSHIWKNEGYLTKKHEEERFKNGRKALERFFKQESGGKLPASIEEGFKIIFEDNKISGRWDRLDEDTDKAVIIDYKSSNVTDQKKADKNAKESIQLAIYAMAYKERTGRLPERVELRFLESGLTGRYQITEEDIEKVKGKIKEVSSGIKKEDFEARPAFQACQFCLYSHICSYTAK